jgi:hypothetical protein
MKPVVKLHKGNHHKGGSSLVPPRSWGLKFF